MNDCVSKDDFYSCFAGSGRGLAGVSQGTCLGLVRKTGSFPEADPKETRTIPKQIAINLFQKKE